MALKILLGTVKNPSAFIRSKFLLIGPPLIKRRNHRQVLNLHIPRWSSYRFTSSMARAVDSRVDIPDSNDRRPTMSTDTEKNSAKSSMLVEYGGATFDVVYEDHVAVNDDHGTTDDKERPEAPIIVGVHGDLGAAGDFKYVVPALVKAGCRLVLPNFPGYGLSTQVSPEETIYHGPVERSNLLSAFLDKLNIDKVDMLLCHSAGSWVGYSTANRDKRIKSVTHLCPVGHRVHRALRLHRLMPIALWVMNTRFGPVIERFILWAYMNAGFHHQTIDRIYVSLRFLNQLNFPKCRATMEKLKNRNLPTLIAFSQADKLIEWQIPYEACQILGIPASHILAYDKDGAPVVPEMEFIDPIVDGAFKRGLMFETGSHYVHKLHTERIVNNMMHVINSIKSENGAKL
ncbi:uncharacterized protein LOC141912805 [Tubulanus polymorphus]|uniref:uncharacterized protein LOC141912805 n=1 Tax=Tubulanus polymorphus TaxID=672921 RepID=UPI003DA4947F